jgi:hypothetical protein
MVADKLATLKIGYEVIITGTKTITKDGGGQICIENAEIVANLYGNHAYSTESFITDKDMAYVAGLQDSAASEFPRDMYRSKSLSRAAITSELQRYASRYTSSV